MKLDVIPTPDRLVPSFSTLTHNSSSVVRASMRTRG